VGQTKPEATTREKRNQRGCRSRRLASRPTHASSTWWFSCWRTGALPCLSHERTHRLFFEISFSSSAPSSVCLCRSFDHMVGMTTMTPLHLLLHLFPISSLVGGPLGPNNNNNNKNNGHNNGAKVQCPCLFPDRELTNFSPAFSLPCSFWGLGTHAGYLKSLNPEVDGVTGRETCPNDPLKPREGSTKVLSLSSFCRSDHHHHSVTQTLSRRRCELTVRCDHTRPTGER